MGNKNLTNMNQSHSQNKLDAAVRRMTEFNCFNEEWSIVPPTELEEIFEKYLMMEYWVPYRHLDKELKYEGKYYESFGKTERHGMGKLTSTTQMGKVITRYQGL